MQAGRYDKVTIHYKKYLNTMHKITSREIFKKNIQVALTSNTLLHDAVCSQQVRVKIELQRSQYDD